MRIGFWKAEAIFLKKSIDLDLGEEYPSIKLDEFFSIKLLKHVEGIAYWSLKDFDYGEESFLWGEIY